MTHLSKWVGRWAVTKHSQKTWTCCQISRRFLPRRRWDKTIKNAIKTGVHTETLDSCSVNRALTLDSGPHHAVTLLYHDLTANFLTVLSPLLHHPLGIASHDPIPSHIRTSSTYTLFLTRLKTHLFAESLLWHCYAVAFSPYFWRPRALDVGRHSKFMLIDWLIDWLISCHQYNEHYSECGVINKK